METLLQSAWNNEKKSRKYRGVVKLVGRGNRDQGGFEESKEGWVKERIRCNH